MQIITTNSFIVESFETPHVDRNEGGHIKVKPIVDILDRTEMNPEMAIDFIRLSMVVGEALKNVMAQQGIELMRVNYHDMGNWAFKKGETPKFHLHVYGRAKNAVKQPYTEAVYLPDRSTGFYDDFTPLTQEDVLLMRAEIERILKEEKYLDTNWFIK